LRWVLGRRWGGGVGTSKWSVTHSESEEYSERRTALISVLSPFRRQGYVIDIEAELVGQKMNEGSLLTKVRRVSSDVMPKRKKCLYLPGKQITSPKCDT